LEEYEKNPIYSMDGKFGAIHRRSKFENCVEKGNLAIDVDDILTSCHAAR
jgi:hypothetical protein